MTDRLELAGSPGVAVQVRRSTRVRRLSLRISRLDGRVTLTAPPHVPQKELRAFLRDRSEWVRGHLETQPDPVAVRVGVRLPVLGEGVMIEPAKVRAARRDGGRLLVAPDRAAAQTMVWLRETARTRLGAACDGYAAQIGKSYTQLALRDTRSRWGSCSSAGRLMFSWRLVMAPPRIVDYVAAHEVAHLDQMNHSAAFWSVVTRLHPTWETDRAWLREHGAWLHRYRFEGEDA